MYRLLFFMVPFLFFGKTDNASLLWGETGHRVVGEIAAKHISKRTARKISKLLDGATLAYVSTYADDIKSDKRYTDFYSWHFANIPTNSTYTASPKNPEGDIVQAIKMCISILKSPSESDENKAFYLKLLVHFVGDIHQPMHLARPEDRGGNEVKLKWFGRNSNLHRLWDSDMINSHNMSYTEMAENVPYINPSERKRIKNTSLYEWVGESYALAETIYENLPEDTNLGYEYRYQYLDRVRLQLLKGGIRLAALLDELFK